MDTIAVPFVYFLPDGFRNANNVTDGTILIFHSHINNAPVIWLSVKFRMDFDPSSAEFFSDIPRKNDIRAALFRYTVDDFIMSTSFYSEYYCPYFRVRNIRISQNAAQYN